MRGIILSAFIVSIFATAGIQQAMAEEEKVLASAWFSKVQPRTLYKLSEQVRTGRGFHQDVDIELYWRALGDRVPISRTQQEIADFFHPAKNKQLVIIPCSPALLEKLEIAAVKGKGEAVWGDRRKTCYPDEEFVYYRNNDGSLIPVVSLACGNTLREKKMPVVAPPPPVRPAATPAPQLAMRSVPERRFRYLLVNLWPQETEKLPGVQDLIIRTRSDNRFKGARVSRAKGGMFRRLHGEGKLPRSRQKHRVRVSLVRFNDRGEIREESPFQLYTVTGLEKIPFFEAQLMATDAIRLVFLDPVVSPVSYEDGTGLAELRFFNHTEEKKLGGWGRYRVMNVHAIVSGPEPKEPKSIRGVPTS